MRTETVSSIDASRSQTASAITLSRLLGFTLSIPYITFLVPWPYWIPVLLVAAFAVTYLLWHFGARIPRLVFRPRLRRSDYAILALLAANVLAIGCGILVSKTLFFPNVYREAAVGVAVLLLFFGTVTLVNHQIALPAEMVKGFFFAIILFSIPASVLGYIKLLLLDANHYISIIIRAYPHFYPWGTSLKSDYNFFGMALLSAALGIYLFWQLSARSTLRFAWSMVAIGFFLAVALNSGSRRVLVSLAIVAILVVARELLMLWTRERGKSIQNLALIGCSAALAVVVVTMRSFLFIPGVETLEMHGIVLTRADAERLAKVTIIEGRGTQTPAAGKPPGMQMRAADNPVGTQTRAADNPIGTQTPKADKVTPFTVNTDIAQRAETIFDSSEGLSSRLERWRLSIYLASKMNILSGMGFDYQLIYSCEYFECSIGDYPHNPALSHLLFAGIIGFFLCTAIFAFCGYVSFLLLFYGKHYVIGVMMVMNILFSFISFDTIFGNPALFTLALLGWCLVRNAPGLFSRTKDLSPASISGPEVGR